MIDVRPYDECQVVAVAGRDRGNLGTTRHFISPFDDIESVRPRAEIHVVGIRAWRRELCAQLKREGPVDKLRTAAASRIDLLPYQLEPALAVLRGLGCRLLIADEVGLGKTIQAGLIAAELVARGAAERVLILTPAGLRDQWMHELNTRFALNAQILDIAAVRVRGAELPIGVNPWTTVPLAVASFDYVKRPEVAPAVASARWDLVVVDEAHAVTAGSDRKAAIDALCGLSPYVILLTATPHNGNRSAFESLCDLGRRNDGPILVFRRCRRDVGFGSERRVHRIYVRLREDERRMHTALALLARAMTRAGTARDIWLALAVLQKRAFSSARSLEQSVVRSLSALPAAAGDGMWQLMLPLDDSAGELDSRDLPPAWDIETVARDAETRRRLEAVADSARAAAGNESKLGLLARLLARLRKLGEPAIVFTEYRDTLAHIQSVLRLDAAVLHGGLAAPVRRAELESFVSGRRSLLLATDAAGEGLNLHHTCRVVINLELPWSPTRIEQRIGRVDRIGQKRRVHAFHLIARDTGEMRLLDHLRAKIERARQDIAADDPLGNMASGEDEPSDDEVMWIITSDSR